MLKCWSYNPECRPTFKYCLEVLQNLKESIIREAMQIEESQAANPDAGKF